MTWFSLYSMKNRLILMFMAFSVLVYLFVASIIETSLKYHFYDQDYQHIKDKYDAVSWGEVLREPPENLVGRINTTVDYWVLKNNHVVATNSGIPLQTGMLKRFYLPFNQGSNWMSGRMNKDYTALFCSTPVTSSMC